MILCGPTCFCATAALPQSLHTHIVQPHPPGQMDVSAVPDLANEM